MTYEEFVQIFNYSGVDFSIHQAIVIFNPPCNLDTFVDYFIENVDNLKEIHHLFVDRRVYVIVNNDIVFKDTLASYIEVEKPVITVVEDGETV
jgi:hypothetical protein